MESDSKGKRKCGAVLCDEYKGNPETFKWKWGEDELPIVARYTYLGVEISKTLLFVCFPHLERIPFLLVQFTFFHCLGSTLLCIATRAPLLALFLLHPTAGKPLGFFWQAQVTCEKYEVHRFFRSPLGRAGTFSFLSLLLTSPIYLYVLPPSPFLALAFPSLLSFILPLSCALATCLWTAPLLGFLLYPAILSRLSHPTYMVCSPLRYFLPYSPINYRATSFLAYSLLTLYCRFNFLAFTFSYEWFISSCAICTAALLVVF